MVMVIEWKKYIWITKAAATATNGADGVWSLVSYNEATTFS